jgi:hypothetical protein
MFLNTLGGMDSFIPNVKFRISHDEQIKLKMKSVPAGACLVHGSDGCPYWELDKDSINIREISKYCISKEDEYRIMRLVLEES